MKATSKSATYKALRLALEEQNLLVLQLPMGKEACRGFSMYDEVVPLIAVNGSERIPSARSYTLLHELAHLLRREESVCGGGEDDVERWCDAFAAAFLMPAHHLLDYLAYLRQEAVDSNDLETVRKISNRYKTSWLSVSLRLIDLGRARWGLYETVKAGDFEAAEKGGFSREPQTTPVVRLREYGSTYARLVIGALDEGRLSELDARRYLDVNGEQLEQLHQRLVSAS